MNATDRTTFLDELRALQAEVAAAEESGADDYRGEEGLYYADVRLVNRATEDGQRLREDWTGKFLADDFELRIGDSQYDTDHHGDCAASSVSADCDVRSVLDDLLSQI